MLKAWNAERFALTVLRARRYLVDFPTHGSAWVVLGTALMEMARYDEAQAALEYAIAHYPPQKLWIPHTRMGHLFKFAGKYESAALWYRKVIDGFPNDATGHICLGGILAKQGLLQEAAEVHRSGTRCTEGCIDEAFLNLGYVLRAQEKFEEAGECFREAIRRDPKYREAKEALRDIAACLKETE